MTSTTSTTSSALSTPAAVDSAALRSCPKCRRRMSSLKHDSHTICSQCREVNCSVDTRCSECKSWSVESMQEHLEYQRSLAGKRSSKKLVVTAASVIQSAVASSPVVSTPSVSASVSDDSRFKDAVLAVLQSLSGSLGINQNSSTAPSTVPDSAPSVGGATGGVVGMKLHNMDSRFESSGVGNPAKSTSPVVLSDNYNVLPSSARHYVGVGTVSAADSAAPVGPSPSHLDSSGADQLRIPGLGPLASSSSALSPTFLLFPLTPSPSFPPSCLPPPPPGFSVSSASFAPSLPSSCSTSSSLSSSPYFSSSAPPPTPSLLPPCPPLLFLLLPSLLLLFLLPFPLFFLLLLLPSFFLPLLLLLILLSTRLPLPLPPWRLSLLLLVFLLPLPLSRLPLFLRLSQCLLFRIFLLPLFSLLLLLLLSLLPFLLFLRPWRTARRVYWDCLRNINLWLVGF